MTPGPDFPIVGVGASAGAVEALEGFFRGMPDKPGLACVIITHLSPNRESMLPEIVARFTDMPVHAIADGTPIEPDNVYLLPTDAVVSVANRTLHVHEQDKARRERKPIDVFLSTLAADVGEMSAGVILSGADSDGTLGIKAIKERGGLTLAQSGDGFGPHHSDMPRSAISTGLVDFAVPAEEMGAKLANFAAGVFTLDGLTANAGAQDDGSEFKEARNAIYSILRSQVGHDFSGYKVKTFLRRVQRRMQVLEIKTAEAYVTRLGKDPEEVAALFRDLLINVTSFFRDAQAFDTLAEVVLPKLLDGRGPDDAVRVWVPGCATGEEVYSIAMLLREQMDGRDPPPRVQIFATDIDDGALAVARAARYPLALLDGVSEERRQRFFVQDASSYVLAKEVRDLCIFSPHSVIRDPPFSRIDLVSCRNLLIYFGTEIQNQVIPTFHYALRPDGYLFLGTSENVSQFDELFTPVEKKHRIFRRRADVAPQIRLPLTVAALKIGHMGPLTPARPSLGGAGLRHMVDNHMLERFTPPHVLVTRDGDVVYYSSRTGKYLEAAPGVPTRQLFALARKGLSLDLRSVFREAVESGRPATREGVVVESEDGRVQVICLTVEPLTEQPHGERMYLVVFEDLGPVLAREEALARAQSMHDGSAAQFEKELRDTRERLQSMIEEYETALEELKSSNEELVSVNEELQSSNEELEASKEELVSLNEELHTVNLELNGKIDALDRSNSDLQNLFESTSVATVFLDRNLVIRSFTPAMGSIFHIRSVDRGRPITELVSRLDLPGLEDDIQTVFRTNQPRERQVSSKEGLAHFLVRLAPYRNGDRQTDGVVIAFVDITGMVHAEERQEVLIAELQHRTRNLLAVIQSIAQQTLAGDPALETFTSRLAALGRLQGLIGEANGNLIDLSEIVRLEFDALGVADSRRIEVSGPVVPLGFRNVQTIALVLHELATNAVKYGALKDDRARLVVRWRVEPGTSGAASLIFDWLESGMRLAPDSSKTGFGRQLIEKALKFTLGAKTALTFNQDGVSCHIEIPLPSVR
ncbi:CheR family methyltransferase [Paraburkholderia rhynchosiae]|uniref:histidine kinase n=1 Tax=Paraburkholderia rhynchosiae TaxID=487049 RepID=A0A2N7WAA5_9BURK|nr:CheR family methyltransferase [Paraburkholderia rhynchosiae]PMS26305.1 chemotaxis protein CheR [Paraburkholderia rhynchosiae]CAB3729795.1 Protein-glutamate methylesterase/protein-glutamine glutaminase [Paraburkholderia rhynchosiae]